MERRSYALLLGCLFLLQSNLFGNGINPDNTVAAAKQLAMDQESLRQKLIKKSTLSVAEIKKMLEIGLFEEANKSIIKIKNKNSADFKLLSAGYLILNNDFKGAERFVNGLLKQQPDLEDAVAIKINLEIQAWRLTNAQNISTRYLLKRNSEKIDILLGRILLLQKQYDSALAIADKVIKQNPQNADAYLLKADVYFWDQQPEKAEAPLIKSLSLNPFNADARFNYGYAIWRRIDATQLNQMAAQWDLALAINPLHYQTHWHWGNGHTNLTYADYAQKEDDSVRIELLKADDAVRLNQLDRAIKITREVEQKYPQSILPLMHRGSIFYTAYDMDRNSRLDSAVSIFRTVLARKKHYGPAHNGLSAAIKSQRIPYLTMYDSIVNSLENTKINDLENFEKVFPDVKYYPGDQVKAMAWNQLFTAVAYFSFLSKQQNSFAIPPLHIDLSIAMKSAFFKYGTTFDNRQWMDIRGVGSGAAAIEYVERGAYLERNVILHEYVHLFHGRVLTDAQNRKIRALYYNAMKENRTLDYYSRNNESEYFAQTYPAYFEPVKVHPLDFKSMNTTSDLQSKDPEMYHFLDELIANEKAYLAGNKEVMASNWAQVYLNLSNRAKSVNKNVAYSLLDTALQYDSKYLPVYLGYAQIKMDDGELDKAEEWLQKAMEVDAGYAPIYVAFSRLEAAKFEKDHSKYNTTLKNQIDYLKKAGELEDDFQEQANINIRLRELYKSHGMIGEALETTVDYIKNGSRISTYLRDRIDDATAFAAVLTTDMNIPGTMETLKELVLQKPQNYEYRNYYSDALAAGQNFRQALQTIKEAQTILSAANNARSDYSLRIAENYFAMNITDSANFYVKNLDISKIPARDKLRYVRLLLKLNQSTEVDIFKETPSNGNPFYKSEYLFTQGFISESEKDVKSAVEYYQKSLELNPYNMQSNKNLKKLYLASGKQKEAKQLEMAMNDSIVKLKNIIGL
ncbi:MAG: tetratricopeptide repeat protein [Ginsengibacter sp.]